MQLVVTWGWGPYWVQGCFRAGTLEILVAFVGWRVLEWCTGAPSVVWGLLVGAAGDLVTTGGTSLRDLLGPFSNWLSGLL